MKIVEQFLSIQGEAQSPGKLAYFIRLALCNLSCKFCDSKFASLVTAKYKNIEINKLAQEIQQVSIKLETKPLIVITGGCPLLYKNEIQELIGLLPNYDFQIETNGTISPKGLFCINGMLTFNVSPKLTSSGNPKIKAIKLNILREFLNYNAIFKFVVANQKDWSEMEEIIDKVKIPKSMIYIMAEGITDVEVKKHARILFPMIIQRGYNFSPRLQVWLFDKKRKV